MDKEIEKRGQRLNKQENEEEIPAGVKYHMYREVQDDMNENKKNHWNSIY